MPLLQASLAPAPSRVPSHAAAADVSVLAIHGSQSQHVVATKIGIAISLAACSVARLAGHFGGSRPAGPEARRTACEIRWDREGGSLLRPRSHAEVLKRLRSADVLVFGSLRDNRAGIVFEALATGADRWSHRWKKVLTDWPTTTICSSGYGETEWLMCGNGLLGCKSADFDPILQWTVRPKPDFPPPKKL